MEHKLKCLLECLTRLKLMVLVILAIALLTGALPGLLVLAIALALGGRLEMVRSRGVLFDFRIKNRGAQ